MSVYATKVWCPYFRYQPSNSKNTQGDYSVVENGAVPPSSRSFGPNDKMQEAPVHGGLFGGPPSNNPWNAIPVTPTMTNMIHNNLRSANPPPGATEQYVGTPRLGNNYVPMPGVYWYNPVGPQQGHHAMKVVHQNDVNR